LDPIKARAAAATPGPWKPDGRNAFALQHGMSYLARSVIKAGVPESQKRTDAVFIAHAREDVPALLAEVERLRAENESLRDAVGRMAATALGIVDRIRSAR
jgi:hypothetical protein